MRVSLRGPKKNAPAGEADVLRPPCRTCTSLWTTAVEHDAWNEHEQSARAGRVPGEEREDVRDQQRSHYGCHGASRAPHHHQANVWNRGARDELRASV